MTNEQWIKISSRAKAAFNFGIEKSEWLDGCKTAKLIAAVPFLAGCGKAEETSFSHLSIYIMSIEESTKEVYFHKPEDDADLYSRLKPIRNFSGGDQKIIQCCMDLLALSMISNYKQDAESDKSMGKYNPVAEGKWDYEAEAAKLQSSIEANITPEIKDIYTGDDALRAFWKG